MRWSHFFIPTLRDDPADAEVVSHRLLLRARFIRQLGAGDRKSRRLNSSHANISYAEFCLKKKVGAHRDGAQLRSRRLEYPHPHLRGLRDSCRNLSLFGRQRAELTPAY